MTTNKVFYKDPQAKLDWIIDLAALTNETGESDWLASGETITDFSVTVSSGITLVSSGLTDSSTSITAWLSGGTLGEDYTATIEWTTSEGRIDQRTIIIKVRNR